MRGFTDKALILCMDPNLYDNKPAEYKARYVKSLDNILNYCRRNLVDPYILATDEIAVLNAGSGVNVLNTVSRGDGYFLSSHSEHHKYAQSIADNKTYKDIITESGKKILLPDNPNVSQRFDCIVKREQYVAKRIIKDFKLVFNFQIKNKMQYHAETKEGDGRIVITINASTFHASAELSGMQMNIIELLDYNGANRSVFLWEV